MEMRVGRRKRQLLTWAAIIVLSLAIMTIAGAYTPWKEWLTDFLEWVESLGALGNIVLIFAFIVISFPFTIGYIPLSLGAGYLYGVLQGTITSSFGSTLGAFLCFIIFRKLLFRFNYCTQLITSNQDFNALSQQQTQSEQGEELHQINSSDQDGNTESEERHQSRSTQATEGPSFLFATAMRLMPFPFGFANALFALTPISWQRYLLSSWIGLAPFQVMWVYLGTTLRNLADAAQGKLEGSVSQTITLLIQLVAAVAVPIFICIYYKKKKPFPPPSQSSASSAAAVYHSESSDEGEEDLFELEVINSNRLRLIKRISSDDIILELSNSASPPPSSWSPSPESIPV